MKSGIVVVSMLLTAAFGPVIAAQSSFTDPVDLLHAVAKSYADGVESFHIGSVTETVRNSELEQDRQVSYQTAIKDTGNHYRIETRSAFGSWVLDSDGTTEWLYLVELNKYSKHPLPDNWPQFPMGIGSSFDLQNAWAMRPWLEGEASSYKHATMLPPETIVIEGHSFDCYVVHVTSDDDTRRRDPERSYSTTYWIDRQALVFRKKVQHDAGYVMMTQKLHLPQRSDVTVMYPVVDLHPQTTGQMFVFTPPAGAAEVASFESDFPAPPQFQAGMLGKPAPDITFTAADGRKVALSSYRGKPVLFDLWATWCGPCLLAMPTLGHLYAEFKDKGLAVITVDQDQTTESAIAYLARHNYSWTNYHDPGNKVGHALQDRMVPLTVLINAQGKIVYYDQGGKEADVRKAIASLGTDFASAARASQ